MGPTRDAKRQQLELLIQQHRPRALLELYATGQVRSELRSEVELLQLLLSGL